MREFVKGFGEIKQDARILISKYASKLFLPRVNLEK